MLRQHLESSSGDHLITDDPEVFFEEGFDLVIEVTGQGIVRDYGERILSLPADFLISSIGVLSDDGLHLALIEAAEKNNVRLLLAGGALPAIDWMSAASDENSTKVNVTQEKPLNSWLATPAEAMIDMQALENAQCFFEDSAREVASQFPRSSNITAMLALSTVGQDVCKVKRVADPFSKKMRTLISFRSELGDLELEWQGIPSETNPRTSIDVAVLRLPMVNTLLTDTVFTYQILNLRAGFVLLQDGNDLLFGKTFAFHIGTS